MATKLWAALLVLFTTLLTSSAQLLYKLGSNSLEPSIIGILTNYYLIGGVLLYVVGGTLLIISLRGGEVSVLYPLIAASYIWVSLMSIHFLNETMNPWKWAGIFVIIAGISCIGYGTKRKKIGAVMTTQLWAIGLVILATLIGAFGPILLKKASAKKLSSLNSLMLNYDLFGGVSLYAISTLLFIPALKGGELSVLYPFVALNYIWVSFLSTKFLGEKMNKFKWLGIFLIIVGVSFIGIGSN